MSNHRELKPEQELFIIESFGKMVQRKIAEEVGCSIHKVRRVLSDNGLIKRDNYGPPISDTRKYPNPYRMVECRCPSSNCGHHEHKQKLFWTGPEPAPKLCPMCINLQSAVAADMVIGVPRSARR